MAEDLQLNEDILRRWERMERELRRWRRGAAIVVSLSAVAAACAMANPAARELSVQTLRIVDSTGKDRLVLTAEPGVPDMTFLDPAGQTRLSLDIAEDRRPVLVVSDSGQESTRLSLGIEQGSPTLQLYDADEKKRITLSVPKAGGPLIRVYGEDGKLRSRFP